MIEDFLAEPKDAEQMAMEMQIAYLAGVENGEMTVAYEGKGKSPKRRTLGYSPHKKGSNCQNEEAEVQM